MPAARQKGKGRARDDEMAVDEPPQPSQSSSSEGEVESEDDPNQPDERAPEAQRKMRKQLRSHTVKVMDAKVNLAGTDIGTMTDLLQAANKNFHKLKTPNEAAIDSQALGHLADIMQQKTRQMRLDKSAFDVNDWLDRVKRVLDPTYAVGDGDDDEDDDERGAHGHNGRWAAGWLEVGRIAARHTLRAPAMDFMIGPLSVEPKKKAPRDATQTQRRDKQKESQHTQAQQIGEGDIEKDGTETTQAVHKLNQILAETGGINFFEFIINPDSFGQTVENLFHLSFLIKEGKATIDMEPDDPDQAPWLKVACQQLTDADRQQAKADNQDFSRRQVILELTEDIWRDAIELYDLKTSMVPTRKKQNTVIAKDKWVA